MPTHAVRSARRTFRLVTALCAVLIPTFGAQLVLGGFPGAALGGAMPLAALIWSVVVHLVLAELHAATPGRSATPFLLASGLGLLLLPGMPLMSGLFWPRAAAVETVSPTAVALAWIAGAGLAALCRAARHLLRLRNDTDPRMLSHPAHLVLAGVILGGGFWLVASALPLTAGQAFAPAPPVAPLLGALYALTSASLLLQGLAALQDPAQDPAPASLPLLAAVAALAATAVIGTVPAVGLLGPTGAAVILLLAGTMICTVLIRQPPLLMGLGMALTGAALAFAATASEAVAGAQAIAVALMLTVLISSNRRSPGGDPITRIGTPPPEAVLRFHEAAGCWIVQLDLEERVLRFPQGSGRALGFDHSASFADLFRDSAFSGVLDLLQALQTGQAGDDPVRLQLTVKDETNAARVETFEAHVLRNDPPTAWLALIRLRREEALAARLARYEKLLGEAVLREERLLSIASHELRTPIAILSMLAEELQSGMDWQDVSASFDKTLQRIVAILDDLRAGSGTEGGQSAGGGFTVREISQQILDIFRPAAEANGIVIHTAPSEHSDLSIRCDYSRVFIALSKLVHNAIVHSKGTDVVLSALVMKGSEGELSVTWQVSDNGVGIAEQHRRRIFEPFETSGENPEERPGLGLYTARKAIRLMGGDLVLQSDGKGCRFVLTHPARAEQPSRNAEQENATMSDVTPAYANRSVLLVEDNKLVGEITCARLRKLFQKVDWAETGDDGLAMFRANQYDMLVVDQLLPGLVGSELVREIRQTDKDLPIIGITASTMGSECRDLEEAGANYALEKPLSFAQLKGLADEFFSRPESEGDG